MKNHSEYRKNGYYYGKKDAVCMDLRIPFAVCASVGLVLLGACAVIGHVDHPALPLSWFALSAAVVFVLTCAIMFVVYLFRHLRFKEAVLAADHINTEITDMFRYVIDVPYAVIGNDGVVQTINSALQDILGYKTSVCNIRLSEFCSVSMDTISTAAHGGKVSEEKSITRLGNGKRYKLESYSMRIDSKEYFFTVFRDVNSILELKERAERENPVVAYIAIDNLQELTQFVRASYRETATRIEKILSDWVLSLDGMIREYDRDKYIAIFSEEKLEKCIADRFSILNTVMDIRIGDNTFPVSVSMGIASVGGSMGDKERAAYAALEVALSRGGNQVALRRGARGGLEYFGGTHKILESNSSINSRVSADVLADKIRECGNVLIMGHANPDFDSVGACVGAARFTLSVLETKARQEGRSVSSIPDVHIVIDRKCDTFRTCFAHLAGLEQYSEMFIDREAGMNAVTSDTLLIIVDANNRFIFEAPDLPGSVPQIALIDHHRLVKEPDFNPFLNYIEPTKSSASEIIAEMMQQSEFADCLQKEEANLLLSGIMLDTHNFTRNAGAQTFEITHYLYSRGAHTSVTREFFNQDLEDMRIASAFDSMARIYRDIVAITWLNTEKEPSPEDRVAAAKAADSLLSLKGIEASFAMVLMGDTVVISGRSKGEINVQLILEKLQGGGHFDVAGAQVKNATIQSAYELLRSAIDDYFEYDYKSEDGK
ncbi:MAG: DHH family phosphoesterase [Clostridia bacterium]|nr:DHH family phosphoesterase [Clostridia bacterium]MBQ7380372.1 DHH family phosphoesterase [Clostridia bacterium]